MIVVDASVVIELLLQTADAPRIASAILTGRETLHAPHLMDVEVAQVVRRYALRGEISGEHGREALAILPLLPISRYPHLPLLSRMWQLRDNLTAYDAAYVALAEGLQGRLMNGDGRMAGAAGHTADVRVI